MKCALAACLLLLSAYTSYAQSDSSFIDLGRIKLKKEFTQTTVIRAEDIAKLPTMSISDLIRIWGNGLFTSKGTTVYVLDGITTVDIDAYHLQDIETITIVRNALTNQHGAANTELLVLVDTKKWKADEKKLTFTAMAHGISRTVMPTQPNEHPENVSSGNFQQYGISFRSGNARFSYGGSVSFVHDVFPQKKDEGDSQTKTPAFDRIKGNIWSRIQLNKNNTLSVHFNYTPQFFNSEMSQRPMKNIHYHRTQYNQIINPYLNLETKTGNFSNKFTFSYITGKLNHTQDLTTFDYENFVSGRSNSQSFYINNSIGYTFKLKNWNLTPFTNINFQSTNNSDWSGHLTKQDGNIVSLDNSSQKIKGALLTASPSFMASYKSILMLQGGTLLYFQKTANTITQQYPNKTLFPFFNGTVNLSPLLNMKERYNWKLFGSYSEKFATYDPFFMLEDHNFTFISGNPNAIFSPNLVPFGSSGLHTPRQWQSGTSLSLWEERLKINYNYQSIAERKTLLIELPQPIGLTGVLAESSRRQHHFSVEGQVIQSIMSWRAGLFANFIQDEIKYDEISQINRGELTNQYRTGGLTNRFSFKQFSAGLDILYNFGATVYDATKINSLQLSHIFVAYTLKAGRSDLELFVSSRNISDSRRRPLEYDGRKYYGGGLKLSL